MQLFDYIASCIAGFVREHHLETKSLPLGFTFSFPCRQEGLAVGKLVTWSKGFKCSGVEGKDVVALLHEAIKRNSVRGFAFVHMYKLFTVCSWLLLTLVKLFNLFIRSLVGNLQRETLCLSLPTIQCSDVVILCDSE